MASVVKRKSSSGKVHYYGKYDAGERTLDGRIVWKMVPTHQPNREAAQEFIDLLQAAHLRSSIRERASAELNAPRGKSHACPMCGHSK